MSGHLKSYAAPKAWTLLRKAFKWTTRPLPGAHSLDMAQAVSLLLKQKGFAQTTREAKKIVNSGAVSVDGKVVKDHHYAVGFMDVVQIGSDVVLRGGLDRKGRLNFIEAPASEAKKRVCRIMGKRSAKGGKVQLSLLGGRTLLTDKKDFAVGDSLVIEVPGQKVLDHLPLAKGASVFLLGGRHTGALANVVSVDGDVVVCKDKDGEFSTRKSLVFVVGKDKPVVKL